MLKIIPNNTGLHNRLSINNHEDLNSYFATGKVSKFNEIPQRSKEGCIDKLLREAEEYHESHHEFMKQFTFLELLKLSCLSYGKLQNYSRRSIIHGLC